MATYLYCEKRVGNLAVRATQSASSVTLWFVPNDGGDDTADVGDTTMKTGGKGNVPATSSIVVKYFRYFGLFGRGLVLGDANISLSSFLYFYIDSILQASIIFVVGRAFCPHLLAQ